MNNQTTNTTLSEVELPDWDEVKSHFVAAWHDGDQPSLHEWAGRHPQFAAQLAEFVIEFAALENAAAREARMHPARPVAATTQEAIQRAIRLTSVAATLAQARKAKGWRIDQLARALNVPDWVALQLERGALRAWPAKLEERLSEALQISRAQITALLQASMATPPAAAAHYHAREVPAASAPVVRTFREALEFCAQQGQLSAEQQHDWLDENAA
ncbi:MAG: hypothetical protein JWN98_99 [Abditibacteriota bacterium]|nr:hypothetical protein [Abditibacteriota bacterium]